MMTLPTFIGIGAPKSGTTWLSTCLSQHPHIYMPRAKELVYFDYGDFEQRLDEYRSYFKAVTNETAIGEFTTRYFASHRPAPRIHAMIPDVKLLLCLRNPVEQIYSHYWHLARQNFHQHAKQKDMSFEEALERFPNLLKQPARYWDHLAYWLTYFDQSQFLIILFDDIKTSPDAVLQKTFQFLGVDANFRPPGQDKKGSDVRTGTSPRSALAQRMHSVLYTSLSRRIYQPLKRTIGVRRGDRLKEALRVRPLMEWLFFKSGYPPIKAGTRRALTIEYADQVQALQSFLKRPLGTWL